MTKSEYLDVSVSAPRSSSIGLFSLGGKVRIASGIGSEAKREQTSSREYARGELVCSWSNVSFHKI